MAHDDYYNRMGKEADARLARAADAAHEPSTCVERYECLASIVGPRTAAAIEAFIDARVAHHELNEHKMA